MTDSSDASDADAADATGETSGDARSVRTGDEADRRMVLGLLSRREIVVPMRLYKTVTVVATLLAMVFVVGGFVVLDTATNRATKEVPEIDPLLGIGGLLMLVLGAWTYAFSTRFRAEGMGTSKTDRDQGSDNG